MIWLNLSRTVAVVTTGSEVGVGVGSGGGGGSRIPGDGS